MVLLLSEGGRSARGALLAALAVAQAAPSAGWAQEPPGAPATAEVSTDLTALHANLRALLADPALARAHVGLLVVAAESGQRLFAHNADLRFTAASTSKLVTGAVALARLGVDYTWSTTVRAAGARTGDVLNGDLWVVGGGDPLFERASLETLARSVRAAGISRITGDLLADDRAFAGPPWGRGWMWDDLYGSYAAGVSALELWPPRIPAELRPAVALGDPARLEILEPGTKLPIRDRVRTGAPGSEIRLEYLPDSVGGGVALSGWIPADVERVPLSFAPPHPTRYFLDRFRRALETVGVRVEGTLRVARADEDETAGPIAWEHVVRSAPLGEVLQRMLKQSDNQVAETLLRTLGTLSGDGSADAGLEVVESTLEGWGIEPGGFSLADGSGMSRYNEIAPSALVRLLRRVSQLSDAGAFIDALPVSSVDGTLSRRFLSTAASRTVRAKTGSLSGVRALAGFVEDGDHETLVFALMLAGYDAPGDVATALEDLLVEQLALYHGPAYPDGRSHPRR